MEGRAVPSYVLDVDYPLIFLARTLIAYPPALAKRDLAFDAPGPRISVSRRIWTLNASIRNSHTQRINADAGGARYPESRRAVPGDGIRL